MMKKFLSTLLLSTLLLTACSSGGSTATSNSGNEETSQASSVEKQTSYKVGDTITFDSEAAITVTSVSYTDERNEFADIEPNKVLLVTYNIDNLSDNDYLIGNEIKLYVDGKKADTYPVAVILDSISANRSYEGATQAFAIIDEGEMELEITPSISFTAKPAIIPITVD